MIAPENTLMVLLIILALGLIMPELFKKLRLPFVTFLIVMGAIFGPNALNIVQSNEVIEFFGFLGMTFLMLMAGLESDLSKIKEQSKKIFVMAALNGIIPFIAGIAIARIFGYSWITSLLIGVVFISSSVAVAIPALKSARIFSKDVGQMILSAALIVDVLSLIVLSFILQTVAPVTKLPLALYFIIVIASIAALFWLLPKITYYLFKKRFKKTSGGEEQQLHLVMAIVIAALIYFSLLGVRAILAAFIIGMVLSQIIKSEKIFSKIHTLGYGLFVPVFFFIVGMEMDFKIFKHFNISDIIMISIIFGLISSKFFSGFIAGRVVKLSKKDSVLFGVTSTAQLTTTLAVTYAASALGLLDKVLTTSIIMLSIITTLLCPVLLKLTQQSIKK